MAVSGSKPNWIIKSSKVWAIIEKLAVKTKANTKPL